MKAISWEHQMKVGKMDVTVCVRHEVEERMGRFSFRVEVREERGNEWWRKDFERGVKVHINDIDNVVRSVVMAVVKDVGEVCKGVGLGNAEQLCQHILMILHNALSLSYPQPASARETGVEGSQLPTESDILPSLATIYNKLIERGYNEEDIYIILDVGRKSLELDVFPLQEEEYAILAERLFAPIGEEKAVNLVRMFLDANPHLAQQCEIPLEQLTPSNIRVNKQIRDYFFKKLVKTFRFAVFCYIHDKLGKKRLRDTLNMEEITQWKMADYYYLRFHILEQKITAKWIS